MSKIQDRKPPPFKPLIFLSKAEEKLPVVVLPARAEHIAVADTALFVCRSMHYLDNDGIINNWIMMV